MIDQLFRNVAARHPGRIAVTGWDGEVTYAELDALAGRLAHRLRGAGARSGMVVGVRARRSTATVAGLLATLRCGAAYLALDGRNPPERDAAILRDAAVKIVLTDAGEPGGLPSAISALGLSDSTSDPSAEMIERAETTEAADPAAVAYVAYTSGSTGVPKGVCVPHRAVVRLVRDNDFLSIRDDDVFVQYAPLAFDASTLELWGPLLNGARLVVPRPEDVSPAELAAFVRRHGVTVLWLTAGLFHQLTPANLTALRGLRHLLAGGDVLSVPQVNRALAALPDTVLVNGYGPTENTTFTACHRVTAPVTGGTVPIGRAIQGSTVHVLDGRLQPVSDGETGELYTGGTGLAHGYLGDPVLTAQRFVADPFATCPGARMYRTGDLVRRRSDLLEFVGRADRQVKIRGFRVEPAEVESAVAKVIGVAEAVVVVQPDRTGERRLVAYVTGDAAVPDIRSRLAQVLPAYAVPARIVRTDSLPLTSNGKVDRAALAARESHGRPEVSAAYRPADGPVVSAVAQLWEDLLGIEGIGADDDFFELGGHSLIGVRILQELRRTYSAEVSPLSFYLDPTPGGLARTVEAARRGGEVR